MIKLEQVKLSFHPEESVDRDSFLGATTANRAVSRF